MTINAADFHPMRGHVAEGAEIRFPSKTLLLRHTMQGWLLIDNLGHWQAPPCESAIALTACVLRLLREDGDATNNQV